MEMDIQMGSQAIVALSSLGIGISFYTLYVKRKAKESREYKAICDLSDNLSCTKAMESEYSSILFLPNSVYGILFYSLMILFSITGRFEWIFYLSVVSVIGSIALAFLSIIRLRILCPLCTIIYLINIAMAILAYQLVF